MYQELLEMIEKAPMTYLPALLIQVAKNAYEKKVFNPGGASRSLESWEKENGRSVTAPTKSNGTPPKCKCGGSLKPAVMCDNCYEAEFGDGK